MGLTEDPAPESPGRLTGTCSLVRGEGARAAGPEEGWTQGRPGPGLAKAGHLGTAHMLAGAPAQPLGWTGPSFPMGVLAQGGRLASQLPPWFKVEYGKKAPREKTHAQGLVHAEMQPEV